MNRFYRPALALVILTGFAAPTPAAETNALREWAVGETIDADIVTPVPLVVFNREQTESLRQTEAQRVPPVFRYQPTETKVAEQELETAFAAARKRFLDLVQGAFQQPALKSVSDLSDPRFSEAIMVFRSRTPGFPLSSNLAELWALGDAGQILLEDWTGQLRRFMAPYLRTERLPEGERLTPPTVRLVQADPPGATGSPSSVPSRGLNIPKSELFPIPRYRRDLASLVPAAERPLIQFIAGFLRPNCSFDEEATATARARRIQDVNVIDRFEAGETMARRGAVVDARLKQALDALRNQLTSEATAGQAAHLRQDLAQARSEATQLHTQVKAEQLKSAVVLTTAQKMFAASESRRQRWRSAAVGGAAACLVFAFLWWRYRQRQRRLERSVNWELVAADGTVNETDVWRDRAMAAEARAEKATAILRSHLLPHMARWMMSELMQRLLSQRSITQGNQQRAELEVAELAERLEKLQAPLEERRQAYERRIQELEAELALRDQQNRDLIQARIESTRRRLDADQEVVGNVHLES